LLKVVTFAFKAANRAATLLASSATAAVAASADSFASVAAAVAASAASAARLAHLEQRLNRLEVREGFGELKARVSGLGFRV
jgi:hypothetical protein